MTKKIGVLIVAVVFAFCAMIPTVFAAPASKVAPTQDLVWKDGTVYGSIEAYSDAKKEGYQVSANKSFNVIESAGRPVGSFTFDKKGNDETAGLEGNLVITLTENVKVGVEWHCSKYYAAIELDGAGVYSLPQLWQDNGKKQSFDQIWIDVKNPATGRTGTFDGPTGALTGLTKSVEGTPIVEWYLENGYNVELEDILAGMIFDLFATEEVEDALAITGDSIATGTVGVDGEIVFDLEEVLVGWYGLVESFVEGSICVEIFELIEEPVFFYVGEQGIAGSAEEFSFVSGANEELGTVIVEDDGVLIDITVGDGTVIQTTKGSIWSAVDTSNFGIAEWVWSRPDTLATGNDGDMLTVEENFYIGGQLPTSAMFYFAADNAAILEVNGKIIWWTESSLGSFQENVSVSDAFGLDDAEDMFGAKYINGEPSGWMVAANYDIAQYLVNGYNTITIYAANSSNRGEGPNTGYNTSNNYAGLIYNCNFETQGFVFNNETKQSEEVNAEVNLGFIGYYINDGKVMSTSIHWQNLKQGDMIDWEAVDAAYDAWVAIGGLVPDRTTWQTSGYASYTFEDYAALGFGDFNLGQLEDYYKNYYVDPGYIVPQNYQFRVGLIYMHDASHSKYYGDIITIVSSKLYKGSVASIDDDVAFVDSDKFNGLGGEAMSVTIISVQNGKLVITIKSKTTQGLANFTVTNNETGELEYYVLGLIVNSTGVQYYDDRGVGIGMGTQNLRNNVFDERITLDEVSEYSFDAASGVHTYTFISNIDLSQFFFNAI